MKRISIITLHFIRNYGSLLQTYATQYKFEKMGYKAEIIDYVRPNARSKESVKMELANKQYGNNILKKVMFLGVKMIENHFRGRVCTNFLKKYVHLSRPYDNYTDICATPPKADIYCTGSDQTWNSEYNGGILPAYYLGFLPSEAKRIGYAVSIGMHSIPQDEREQIKSYICHYNAISVREASAKALLEELGASHVEHVLDPTLVLNRDDWKPLIAKRLVKEKYILIYKLNNNSTLEAYAKQIASRTGYRIVRITYYLSNLIHGGKCFFCPEVSGFLSLIDNAEYVLTDSFHCTAFSLNFHKEFYVFYPEKYSTRLQSILELTATEHRVVKELNDCPEKIDYVHVESVLNLERDKVTSFIEENC